MTYTEFGAWYLLALVSCYSGGWVWGVAIAYMKKLGSSA